MFKYIIFDGESVPGRHLVLQETFTFKLRITHQNLNIKLQHVTLLWSFSLWYVNLVPPLNRCVHMPCWHIETGKGPPKVVAERLQTTSISEYKYDCKQQYFYKILVLLKKKKNNLWTLALTPLSWCHGHGRSITGNNEICVENWIAVTVTWQVWTGVGSAVV